MKLVINENPKVLAEHFACSLAQAEGFIEGETARRRGKPTSPYVLVGMDDYCMGFRAGYFGRPMSDHLSGRKALGSEIPPSRIQLG